MSSDRIALSPEFLAGIEQNLRRLPVATAGAMYLDFSASGPVHNAYADLHEKWSDHYRDLSEALEQLAQVAQAIRSAFESTDQQLSEGLSP